VIFPEVLEAYRLGSVLDRLVFIFCPIFSVIYRLAYNTIFDILFILVPVVSALCSMYVPVASPA
jgi:hypothetical protein